MPNETTMLPSMNWKRPPWRPSKAVSHFSHQIRFCTPGVLIDGGREVTISADFLASTTMIQVDGLTIVYTVTLLPSEILQYSCAFKSLLDTVLGRNIASFLKTRVGRFLRTLS